MDCPILFLTAKTEDAALVQGFGLGADDYIKKPFSIAELRARVNAHLRREGRQPVRAMARGGVRFDMQAKEAMVEEQILPLTKGEYEICEHLALHAGQVFPKNSCMRRSLVSMRRGIRGRLQSILKISAQN